MWLNLEVKKIKRTGFTSTFLIGGLLAAAIIILNTALRSEIYIDMSGTPLNIMINANWQMVAMLNVLLIVAGSCLMYHTEYEENAIQKIKTLPIKEINVFAGKVILLSGMYAVVLAIESFSLLFSSYHWFGIYNGFWIEFFKNIGYFFILGLPSIMLSLLIASAFKNMWVSLGVGIIGVFFATMIYNKSFILSLFPYAMSFQLLDRAGADQAFQFAIIAFIEFIVIGVAEWIFLKTRRSFE